MMLGIFHLFIGHCISYFVKHQFKSFATFIWVVLLNESTKAKYTHMYKYQNHTFEDKSKLYKTFSLILLVKQCYYTYIHAMIYVHYCKRIRCVGSILTKFRICGRWQWLQFAEWTMKSFLWIWMGALRSYTRVSLASTPASFTLNVSCYWT